MTLPQKTTTTSTSDGTGHLADFDCADVICLDSTNLSGLQNQINDQVYEFSATILNFNLAKQRLANSISALPKNVIAVDVVIKNVDDFTYQQGNITLTDGGAADDV